MEKSKLLVSNVNSNAEGKNEDKLANFFMFLLTSATEKNPNEKNCGLISNYNGKKSQLEVSS